MQAIECMVPSKRGVYSPLRIGRYSSARTLGGLLMVKFGVFVSAVVLSLSVGSFANAQNLRDVRPPAETPPASFTGNQYVDSRGCVYIRARGVVTWVPRVNRQRQHICGQTPSLARVAPQTQVAQAPVQQRVVQQPRVVQQAPVVATAPATTTRRVTTVTRPVGSNVCPGRTGLSQAYTSSGRNVRCGPQTTGVISAAEAQGQYTTTTNGVTVRTKPQTVLQKETRAQGGPAWATPAPNDRVVTTRSNAMPNGLRPVWEDDRLNPNRGLTNTRRVATSSAPAVSSSHRYVQAGSFSSFANANGLASRLQARGLPARIGQGNGLNVVLVGPFSSPNGLSNALQVVRSMGMHDAFTRR